MELFIDSANLAEIRKAFSWGIVSGVTTNPSLLKKAVDQLKKSGEPITLQQYIAAIVQTAGSSHPVSLEVTALDAQTMIAQGKRLYQLFNGIAGNVVVKIPVNTTTDLENSSNSFSGLIAIRELSRLGIPTNATLVFTPEQALLAAKAGATFVSPFAGRIDDFLREKTMSSYDKTAYFPAVGLTPLPSKTPLEDNGVVSGVDLVSQIVEIFQQYHLECKVLAASLRNPRQVRECALSGSDAATLPFTVLQQMIFHAKTAEGMKTFMADVVPEYAELLGSSHVPQHK